ncbi:hypothetical protein ACQP2F_11995 [Actinoplanes sp. CA-030573]|uniref:hypothetical protein n=1 Tax=Actinoplanes sp. CA-030573 TaxID=3239898 RepID=UPI003D8F9110
MLRRCRIPTDRRPAALVFSGMDTVQSENDTADQAPAATQPGAPDASARGEENKNDENNRADDQRVDDQHEVEQRPEDQRPEEKRQDDKRQDDKGEESNGALFGFLGLLAWGAVIAVIAYRKPIWSFLTRWWWIPALVLLLVAVALATTAGRRWLLRASASARAALVIFVIVPAILGVVGSVAVFPQRYQLISVRIVFLIIVCLLPAAMWYLFIATRKASLLNDFLASLARLGLLRIAEGEDNLTRKRRVLSYLQRFEAVYGDLPKEVYDAAIENREVAVYKQADVSGQTGLSTTTLPVLFSTVLIALGWLVTLPPGEVLQVAPAPFVESWWTALVPKASPITLAFLGAYFFSLQMLFRRYVLKDLRGSAYTSVSMRIILAVIGVWVLMVVSDKMHLLTEGQLLLAGFVVGVFPRVFWQIIESVFKRTFGKIALPSMRSDLPISDLDGITVWHEARLEEEDIENLSNMATADLVELMLNTRMPRERIIDWTDQAILYTQLGPQGKDNETRDLLRAHGVRTATSFLCSFQHQRLRGSDTFERILERDGFSVAADLESSLSTNSNLELIKRWRRMPAPVRRADTRRKVPLTSVVP